MTIYGEKDSYAEIHANQYKIPFVAIKSKVLGDTNGDGKVSAQDFAKVKSHLLGATQLSGNSIYAADTNKDGKISAQDFAKIKSHLLGASQLQQ